MSILWQRPVPIPDEFKVEEETFYVQMGRTIRRMSENNIMLVAYQTTPERVGYIKDMLFGGLNISIKHSAKNATSTLREYLFTVYSS